MNDIFKDMQAKVGCDYISDLPSYKRKVWQEMKRLNPADYEERQLDDFYKYVFGMSYQTLKDVMKQQKGVDLYLAVYFSELLYSAIFNLIDILARYFHFFGNLTDRSFPEEKLNDDLFFGIC